MSIIFQLMNIPSSKPAYWLTSNCPLNRSAMSRNGYVFYVDTMLETSLVVMTTCLWLSSFIASMTWFPLGWYVVDNDWYSLAIISLMFFQCCLLCRVCIIYLNWVYDICGFWSGNIVESHKNRGTDGWSGVPGRDNTLKKWYNYIEGMPARLE